MPLDHTESTVGIGSGLGPTNDGPQVLWPSDPGWMDFMKNFDSQEVPMCDLYFYA